ncbi:hypothetical protein EVAR_43116_1 [Eumeta japonica]|uniref:ATP-dependent DNA helicase n=1 Tax=Eumeta variegata TaxID=151549 RepID=A0A4C1YEK9_EUMVA|nr:hypothetical protein EVAR_43116_1 [Eumeta japonica]
MSEYCSVPRVAHAHATAAPSHRAPPTASPTNDLTLQRSGLLLTSVEWQKRGLPHAYISIWLEKKVRAEQINDVIREELQDQEVNPELFDDLKTHMVHGSCAFYNPRSPTGDFRQTLPVLTKGTRADEINFCLKRSELWRHGKKLYLKENMEAHSADSDCSKIILDVEEEKCPEL